MNTDTPAAVKVVFIAGTGRSGSTVLSSILGQVPGCFAAGEVRYVWERGLLEDHRCGCGEPFSRCPVWKAVMEEAFRGRPAPDAAATASRLDSRLRVRRVPGMVWRRMHGRPALKPHPDDLIIMRLYEALAAREGVQMVVDSSKLPPYGMLLSSLPGLELYIVHIARDPRATAFSWRRKKTTQDTAAGSTMPRLETWRSAILWLLWNLLIDAWWPRSSPRRLLVRYEDLIRDPTTAIGRVLHMIGAELPPDLISGHTVTLSATHSVAGNPSRHETGVIELRDDDEWQHAMRASECAKVTVLTSPGLRRYGYSWGSGKDDDDDATNSDA